MDSTRILLIRHGQSQGNAEQRFGGHTATPLSELGRRQAEATARALAVEGVTAIYASDLRRAVETAEPLARETGLEVKQTSAFRERSVGQMEGLTFEEAAGKYPDEYAALLRSDFEHVLLGGESYRQLLERSARALDEVINENRGGSIAVFTQAQPAFSPCTCSARSMHRPCAPSGSGHRTAASIASICGTTAFFVFLP